ncbi:MAG: hypothetical protein WKG07_32155 [Hymenobacter sp.]
MIYRVQVPLSSVRKRIGVFDGNAPTSFALTVKEAQRPRPLNFVQVNYGNGPRPITQLNGPVLYDKTIPDVVFSFNTNVLDESGNLYGRQYLTMDIRTVDDKGNLIDQRTVDQLIICPGESSPRYACYQGSDCQAGDFSLNSILGRKAYDLDAWYRIIITVRDDARQYGTKGYSQQVELVLRRHVNFDISVSFRPACSPSTPANRATTALAASAWPRWRSLASTPPTASISCAPTASGPASWLLMPSI